MQKFLDKILNKVGGIINGPKTKTFLKWCLVVGLILIVRESFAAGKDLLAGATNDLHATLGGGGRTVIYLAEALGSIEAYRKTKNLAVFSGIVVVALVLNYVLGITQ